MCGVQMWKTLLHGYDKTDDTYRNSRIYKVVRRAIIRQRERWYAPRHVKADATYLADAIVKELWPYITTDISRADKDTEVEPMMDHGQEGHDEGCEQALDIAQYLESKYTPYHATEDPEELQAAFCIRRLVKEIRQIRPDDTEDQP